MPDNTPNKKGTDNVVKITANVERRAAEKAAQASAAAIDPTLNAMDIASDALKAEAAVGEPVCKDGVCEILWKPQRPAA